MKNLSNYKYCFTFGFYSLRKLKPTFTAITGSDYSDIKRGTKEEADAIWKNATVKTIGRIPTKTPHSHLGNFRKPFEKFPYIR